MPQYLVSSDKTLDEFPKSFKNYFTPYCEIEGFSEVTRKFAHDYRNLPATVSNLKICKIIILGDLCVGKTSLLNRFCHKIFECDYRTTIGVDFQAEQVHILGVPYQLQIWDTAGQERFKCIAQCYYRRAHVIMVVFDMSSLKTLANCKTWLREGLDAAHGSESPYLFLIGTKRDLLAKEACRNVESIAEKTAINLNCEFWSVSSKTGENIDNLFFRTAALSFNDHIELAVEENLKNGPKIGNSDLISFKKNNDKKKKFYGRCEGSNFKCGKM